MKTSRVAIHGAVGVVVAIMMAGCGSSSSGQAKSSGPVEPSSTQVGRTQVRTVGADLEGVVSYKFADSSLGDEWLIIDVALTGQRAASIEVKQQDVSIRTPDGRRIPLPTQKEFIDAYPQLQSALRRAAIASEPLEATRGGKRPCDLNFLRLPGTGSTRDAIWVNQNELCVGMLAFPVAGGIQPGRWKLIIELEESSLEIPFDLGQ
jgi:hypothetical protein